MDRSLLPAFLLLFASFLLFEWTGIDLAVQDRFYDFGAHRWIVDPGSPLPRILFYTAPKAVLFLLGLGAAALALGPGRWRTRLRVPEGGRRDLAVVVASLALIPALAGLGKATTNVHCPSEIRRYGGDVPYVKTFSPYPADERPERRGRCFPAGHASGGFALLSLAGLARRRGGRRIGVLAGLAAGWIMGGYQMVKGAHYLSHTWITMVGAWIVFLLLRRVTGAGGGFEGSSRRNRGSVSGI